MLLLLAIAVPVIVQIAYTVPVCTPKVSSEAVLQYYGLFAGIAGTARFAFSTTLKKAKAEVYANAKAGAYTEAIEQCEKLRANRKLILDNDYLKSLKKLEAKIKLYASDGVRSSYRDILVYLKETRKAYDHTLKHADEHFYNPYLYLRDPNDPDSLEVDFRPICDEAEAFKAKRLRELKKKLLPTSEEIKTHLDGLFKKMRDDYHDDH